MQIFKSINSYYKGNRKYSLQTIHNNSQAVDWCRNNILKKSEWYSRFREEDRRRNCYYLHDSSEGWLYANVMSVCNDLPKSNLHLYKWFCANIRVNGDTIIDPIVGDKFFISDDDRAMIFIIFDKDDAVKFRLSCTGFTSIL